MALGIFGGDTSQEHYCARICYEAFPVKTRGQRDARNAAAKKVREAFGRERYFQFPRGNVKKGEHARKHCENFAAQVQAATGVKMSVNLGCFI